MLLFCFAAVSVADHFACLQTKGYAEGAGDSLAGGLKKNVNKVTGNEAKQAEGESPAATLPKCSALAVNALPCFPVLPASLHKADLH